MQLTKTLRSLLVLSGLVAMGIGVSLVASPIAFHAGYGIELGDDASLLSEVRAPGGALLALGALMLAGAFSPALTLASTSIASAVYLGYGVARLVAIALDGMPDPGLVAAAVVELLIGGACAVALVRGAQRAGERTRAEVGEAA